jgi:hypothetical protein
MPELKPCKCGGKATFSYMDIHDHRGGKTLVYCSCLFCITKPVCFFETKEAAIAAWNKWVMEEEK